jgi:hypothetical protein
VKRISIARRLIGTFICIGALLLAPRRYEVEALAELSRLWRCRRAN